MRNILKILLVIFIDSIIIREFYKSKYSKARRTAEQNSKNIQKGIFTITPAYTGSDDYAETI